MKTAENNKKHQKTIDINIFIKKIENQKNNKKNNKKLENNRKQQRTTENNKKHKTNIRKQ